MEDAKKFIVKQGCCPNCGSEHIDYYDADNSDDYFFYKCECMDCKSDFVEVYKMIYDGFNYTDIVGNEHIIDVNGNEIK